MARMIPPECPSETPSRGEKKVFEVLKRKLDREYIVIHSLSWLNRDTQRHLRAGECDFLVFHPQKGMLALEVKAGDIRFDPTEKRWYQNDHPLEKDPYQQAQKAVIELNKRLADKFKWWEKLGYPFGHGVVFSDADRTIGDYPLHARKDITVLRDEVDDLPACIERMLKEYGPQPQSLNREQTDAVLERLLPEFQVCRSIRAKIEDADAAFHHLTEGQYRMLEVMQDYPRLFVNGGAGSGKSMLACMRASELAESGKTVLLLCFNRFLSDYLKQQISIDKDKIDVYHYDKLAKKVIQETGGRWNVPEDAEEKRRFFEIEVPRMMEEAVDKYDKRYDAIIVDEGQDFSDYWWLLSEKMLREPEKGIFYIFADPEQAIYQKAPVYLFTEPHAHLPYNCRNTRAIAEWTHRLIGADTKILPTAPPGDPVEMHQVEDEAEELQAVRKTLHELVNVKRLSSDDIVILDRHLIGKSSFASVRTLGNFNVTPYNEAKAANDIRFSTIQAFKGLEEECVLLTGVGIASENIDAEHERILTYVGASRAKLLLHVFHRPGCFVERVPRPA